MIGIDSKRIKEKGITLLEAIVSTAIVGIGFIAVVPVNRSREFEIQSKKINEPVVKIGEIIQGNQLEFKGNLNID